MHHSWDPTYQCQKNHIIVPSKDRVLDLSGIKAKQNSYDRQQSQNCGQRVHFSWCFAHGRNVKTRGESLDAMLEHCRLKRTDLQ